MKTINTRGSFLALNLLLVAAFLSPGCRRAAEDNRSAGKPRVALIMKSLANEFFLTMENGAKRY